MLLQHLWPPAAALLSALRYFLKDTCADSLSLVLRDSAFHSLGHQSTPSTVYDRCWVRSLLGEFSSVQFMSMVLTGPWGQGQGRIQGCQVRRQGRCWLRKGWRQGCQGRREGWCQGCVSVFPANYTCHAFLLLLFMCRLYGGVQQHYSGWLFKKPHLISGPLASYYVVGMSSHVAGLFLMQRLHFGCMSTHFKTNTDIIVVCAAARVRQKRRQTRLVTRQTMQLVTPRAQPRMPKRMSRRACRSCSNGTIFSADSYESVPNV